MSFRCGVCSRATSPKEKAEIRPAGVREREYPHRRNAQRVPNQLRRKWRSDPGGIGSEWTGQTLVCPECV